MGTTVRVPIQLTNKFRAALRMVLAYPKMDIYFTNLILHARDMIHYSDGFEIMDRYLSPNVQARVYAQL